MTRYVKSSSILLVLMLVLGMVLAACGQQGVQQTVEDAVGEISTTATAVNVTEDDVEDAVATGTTLVPDGDEATTEPTGAMATPTMGEDTGMETPGATVTTTSGNTGAVGSGDTSKGTATIISSLPLTGSSLGQTQTIVNGMEMAIEDFGGAAGGYKIEFVSLDDATAAAGKWTAEAETANANRAVRENATVYLGTYNSGAAAFSIPILNKAGIPMISPANTAPELTKQGFDDQTLNSLYPGGQRNYFRVVPADDLQGAAGANYAQELGVKRVFVLHDQEVYGKGIAQVFRSTAEENGIEVVSFEGIDPKAGSYQSLMNRIANEDVDMVYFGGLTQTNGGQLLKDLRAVADPEEIAWMGPDGTFEEAFIEAAGAENAEGAYATFSGGPYDQLQGRGAEFYTNYKERYGSEPEAYAIFGYDAMLVALQAIEKAGSNDPAKVLAALRNLGEVEGALGAYTFDENGDTSLTTMNVYQVRDGEWQWVKSLSAE